MEKILNKIIDYFKPTHKPTGSNDVKKKDRSGKFNNKEFGTQLLEHFKQDLEDLSFGQRMLYPMSFIILMHPDDLAQVRQSLPFIFPEVVAEFYKVIESRRHEFPKYKSPAKHWVFKVSESDVDRIPQSSGDDLLIEKGKITTISMLYTENLTGHNQHSDNVKQDYNVRVSVHLKDSNVKDYGDINLDLTQSYILGYNKFIYPFNINLPTDSDDVYSIDKMKEIATFSYSTGATNYSYLMKDNDIIISGSNDQREDYDVFKINSKSIMNTHAQVKYDSEEKRFKIAVYGKTRLNEQELHITKDSNIVWHDLPDNSDIFINNEITLRFKIKK